MSVNLNEISLDSTIYGSTKVCREVVSWTKWH